MVEVDSGATVDDVVVEIDVAVCDDDDDEQAVRRIEAATSNGSAYRSESLNILPVEKFISGATLLFIALITRR